jgi:hypothetical protein
VLVKEVFEATTEPMKTGTVSLAENLKGWFVMMRDSNNQHSGNKLWVTAGAGRGLRPQIHQKQLRLTTRWTVSPVMCRRKPPIGFTSLDTRRSNDRFVGNREGTRTRSQFTGNDD